MASMKCSHCTAPTTLSKNRLRCDDCLNIPVGKKSFIAKEKTKRHKAEKLGSAKDVRWTKYSPYYSSSCIPAVKSKTKPPTWLLGKKTDPRYKICPRCKTKKQRETFKKRTYCPPCDNVYQLERHNKKYGITE